MNKEVNGVEWEWEFLVAQVQSSFVAFLSIPTFFLRWLYYDDSSTRRLPFYSQMCMSERFQASQGLTKQTCESLGVIAAYLKISTLNSLSLFHTKASPQQTWKKKMGKPRNSDRFSSFPHVQGKKHMKRLKRAKKIFFFSSPTRNLWPWC